MTFQASALATGEANRKLLKQFSLVLSFLFVYGHVNIKNSSWSIASKCRHAGKTFVSICETISNEHRGGWKTKFVSGTYANFPHIFSVSSFLSAIIRGAKKISSVIHKTKNLSEEETLNKMEMRSNFNTASCESSKKNSHKKRFYEPINLTIY